MRTAKYILALLVVASSARADVSGYLPFLGDFTTMSVTTSSTTLVQSHARPFYLTHTSDVVAVAIFNTSGYTGAGARTASHSMTVNGDSTNTYRRYLSSGTAVGSLAIARIFKGLTAGNHDITIKHAVDTGDLRTYNLSLGVFGLTTTAGTTSFPADVVSIAPYSVTVTGATYTRITGVALTTAFTGHIGGFSTMSVVGTGAAVSRNFEYQIRVNGTSVAGTQIRTLSANNQPANISIFGDTELDIAPGTHSVELWGRSTTSGDITIIAGSLSTFGFVSKHAPLSFIQHDIRTYTTPVVITATTPTPVMTPASVFIEEDGARLLSFHSLSSLGTSSNLLSLSTTGSALWIGNQNDRTMSSGSYGVHSLVGGSVLTVSAGTYTSNLLGWVNTGNASITNYSVNLMSDQVLEATKTATPTHTRTITPLPTPTFTKSLTSTITRTFTLTATPTPTPSITKTITVSPTISTTFTVSPTFTITPTFSISPTISQTFTVTPTVTQTFTHTPTATVTLTPLWYRRATPAPVTWTPRGRI